MCPLVSVKGHFYLVEAFFFEKFTDRDPEFGNSVGKSFLVVNERKADGGLRLSQAVAGVISHRKTGEQVWFNQAPQFHPSDYPPEVYESLPDMGDRFSIFGSSTGRERLSLRHHR